MLRSLRSFLLQRFFLRTHFLHTSESHFLKGAAGTISDVIGGKEDEEAFSTNEERYNCCRMCGERKGCGIGKLGIPSILLSNAAIRAEAYCRKHDASMTHVTLLYLERSLCSSAQLDVPKCVCVCTCVYVCINGEMRAFYSASASSTSSSSSSSSSSSASLLISGSELEDEDKAPRRQRLDDDATLAAATAATRR